MGIFLTKQLPDCKHLVLANNGTKKHPLLVSSPASEHSSLQATQGFSASLETPGVVPLHRALDPVDSSPIAGCIILGGSLECEDEMTD